MPFILREEPCKKCGECNKLTRSKWHKPNQRFYLQTTCKDCERKATAKHQDDNPDRWSLYNSKWYMKKSEGKVSRRNNMHHTEESRRQWSLDKSNRRCTRAKKARVSWGKDFTDFVYKEAHELRKLRNKFTNIEWHVDHIIPLKGGNVSGLHVWNNFAVIPKEENLRKGNKNSIPEKWCPPV